MNEIRYYNLLCICENFDLKIRQFEFLPWEKYQKKNLIKIVFVLDTIFCKNLLEVTKCFINAQVTNVLFRSRNLVFLCIDLFRL